MNELRLGIPYQENHSRWRVLLRPILALPIIVVMLMMIVPNYAFDPFRIVDLQQGVEGQYHDLVNVGVEGYEAVSAHVSGAMQQSPWSLAAVYGYGALLLVYLLSVTAIAFSLWFMYVINFSVVLTLLFRQKYPSWWFGWNQSIQAFVLRIYCFSLFLTDRYPSLEAEESQISLHLPNPVAQPLNRFLPLVKWVLVLPYLAVYLVFLSIAVALIPVTFAILLATGKLPRWIYRYQVAVIRFYLQISAYAFLLVTDKYPKMIFMS